MEGLLLGVFGTEANAKSAIEGALAKKSEAEGITVHSRTESGTRVSFLDDPSFPGPIQGYSSIASISDSALYVFPKSGRLSPPDGELAVLVESFGLTGRVVVLDDSASPETAQSSLRGTTLAHFPLEKRASTSSVFDLKGMEPRPTGAKGCIIYTDRVFTVKGVGTVALGFVLQGKVTVHDQLRPIGGPDDLRVDVRSIQINDQDFDSAGRGMRVGLSLRGVEADALTKSFWFDDGATTVADQLRIDFKKSPFYKQELAGRELHVQLPGELLSGSMIKARAGELTAKLPIKVPVWDGMRVAILDLNGKGLRVAGGGECRL